MISKRMTKFSSKNLAKLKFSAFLAELASYSLRNNEPQDKFIETLNFLKDEIDCRIKDCSGEDR